MPRPSESTLVVVPPPAYTSWDDYLTHTTEKERRAWCSQKARRANRERLLSGRPDLTLTVADVWMVLEDSRGHCAYCGSLAVERRPSRPDGAPLPWDPVGRRIGSLDHVTTRFGGGSNAASNLVWSCLWCNTWVSERFFGATDHGGIQGDDDIDAGELKLHDNSAPRNVISQG